MSAVSSLSRPPGPGQRLPLAPGCRRELGRDALLLLLSLAFTAAMVYVVVVLNRPTLAIALLVAALTALFILIRPLIGLYLLVLSVPIQDVGAVSIGSLNLTATKVIVVLAMAGWILHRLASREERRVNAPLLLPFVFLLFMMTASVLAARSLGDSFSELFRWTEAFLTYVMATYLLRTRRQVLLMAVVLLAGPTLEAIMGLRQFATGAGPASFAITDTLSRAYGTFGMPNSYAGYLGMGFSLALSIGLYYMVGLGYGIITGRWPSETAGPRAKSAAARFVKTAMMAGIASGVAALIAAGILASLSRGAWMGLLFGLTAMALAAGRKALIPGVAIFVLVTTLMVSGNGNMLPQILTDRISSITTEIGVFDVRGVMVTPANFAVVERMAQWQTGATMFAQNPILGIGIGNYNAAYPQYYIFPWVNSPGHTHNYYIQIAAETGIGGLLAYLILISGSFWQAGLAVRKAGDPLLRAVAVGVLGVITAMAVHNVFENLHVLSMGIQWASLLAVASVIPMVSKATTNRKTECPLPEGGQQW